MIRHVGQQQPQNPELHFGANVLQISYNLLSLIIIYIHSLHTEVRLIWELHLIAAIVVTLFTKSGCSKK